MARDERMCTIERNDESELNQKLPTLASRCNDIQTDVIIVVLYLLRA